MSTTYCDKTMFRYIDRRGYEISVTRTPRKDGQWTITRRVTGKDGYYKPALSFETVVSHDDGIDMWPRITNK